MDSGVVGHVELEVVGLERIQELIEELDGHLQAVQAAIEEIGAVELEIRAVTPPGDTPDRS